MAKSSKNKGGFVFSTDSNFDYSQNKSEGQDETIPNSDQRLRVWLERKGGNKTTTVVRDFVGTIEDLQKLGKELKGKCGTGGSVKDGEIIIQGDHRTRILYMLKAKSYSAKASGS